MHKLVSKCGYVIVFIYTFFFEMLVEYITLFCSLFTVNYRTYK